MEPPLMRRRELFSVMAALGLTSGAEVPASTPAAAPAPSGAFDAGTVRGLARDLARKPYQPPDSKLPDVLANLKYSDYQTLRFDPGKALWHGTGPRFSVEFFHRGFL